MSRNQSPTRCSATTSSTTSTSVSFDGIDRRSRRPRGLLVSRTAVVGMLVQAWTLPEKASSASPTGLVERGVVDAQVALERSAPLGGLASRMLMPTNSASSPLSRPPPRRARVSRSRHGAQPDHQVFTTTTPVAAMVRQVERLARQGLTRQLDRSAPLGDRDLPSRHSLARGCTPCPRFPAGLEQPTSSRDAQQGGGRRKGGKRSGPALLGGPAGRERCALVAGRGSGRPRARSRPPGSRVPSREVERGQRAERALPLPRVVQERPVFHVQPGDPDRQLVGDDHRLVAGAASRASSTAAIIRATSSL